MRFVDENGTLTVRAVAPNVIRVDYRPNSGGSNPTIMMDRNGLRQRGPYGKWDGQTLHVEPHLEVVVTKDEIHLGLGEHDLLKLDRAKLSQGLVSVEGDLGNLYGIRSYGLKPIGKDPRVQLPNGLLRNQGGAVAAGTQGDGGAPLVYNTQWGLLVDSIDGDLAVDGKCLTFSGGSRRDVECYLIVGGPKAVMEAATQLTGAAPMVPKWSLGFMHSQWGDTEDVVGEIVATYRKKSIPLDVFIFDFDYKAWGEDGYGELRWNSSNGPGSVFGNKFPNGANGKFAKAMRQEGVRFVGIMKPRILTKNEDGTLTQAAKDVTENKWWIPGAIPYEDYFSHRECNNLNFENESLRKWYWSHCKQLFETGIVGWWNDEADDFFPSLGHYYMQKALHDGQSNDSDLRVWSINRNFYLGAQTLGYSVWSGDIRTGFKSLQVQRNRMLTMLGLAQPHWTMDGGGFFGKPEPEVYARWIQMAAVIPIMRVHGSYQQHRAPWEYGSIAEEAAKRAIELRMRLLPTFYSLEADAADTGVGIVRPMHWEFPDDPKCANIIDAWMIGTGLLVAPIVQAKQKRKAVYLPEGRWFDFHSGRRYLGGRTVAVSCDSERWSDLPLFVRSGTIVASCDIQQHVDEKKIEELTLDIWPDRDRVGTFTVYDDDGATMAYADGSWFRQNVSAKQQKRQIVVSFGFPEGSFETAIKRYRLRVHNWSSGDEVIEAIAEAGVAGRIVIPKS